MPKHYLKHTLCHTGLWTDAPKICQDYSNNIPRSISRDLFTRRPPDSANIWVMLVTHGPHSAKCGQTWSFVSEFGPTWRPTRDNFTNHAPGSMRRKPFAAPIIAYQKTRLAGEGSLLFPQQILLLQTDWILLRYMLPAPSSSVRSHFHR